MLLPLKKNHFFHLKDTIHASPNLTVTLTVFKAPELIPLHFHQDPYIAIILKGGYREQGDGFDDILKAGDMVFHPKDEPHKNEIGPIGATVLNISIQHQFWVERGIENLHPTSRKIFKDTCIKALANSLWLNLNNSQRQSAVGIEGAVLAILDFFIEKSNTNDTSPNDLNDVSGYLLENYQSTLNADIIAKNFDYTPETLMRKFKQFFGISISERLLEIRLHEAEKLLTETSLNLADIAFDTGFFDQSHLAKNFKKWKGVSPGKYRKIIKNLKSK